MRDVMVGFARPLRTDGAAHLSGLGAAGLAEHGQQDHPSIRRQPVGHPGLLAQQMEPELADLAAEVTGVRLTECLGTLGEQADDEVDPAKVSVREAFQPGPDFRLDLDLIQIRHASEGICIQRYMQAGRQAASVWHTCVGSLGAPDDAVIR